MQKDLLMRKIGAGIALLFATLPAVMANENLAKAKNCMACHTVTKRIIGPAYQDVALKYRGDAAVIEKLVGKILNGGAGAWGPVPMPPQRQAVTEAEARLLARWILSLGSSDQKPPEAGVGLEKSRRLCEGYGFAPGSNQFAQCVMQVDLIERESNAKWASEQNHIREQRLKNALDALSKTPDFGQQRCPPMIRNDGSRQGDC